ncbi:MAG: hypothetical protein ACRC8W_03005 [Plesiomonas shigelloides]
MSNPKVNYQPKGGMCAKCIHKHEDCSKLDFSKMKQIQRSSNSVIVKCVNFERNLAIASWLNGPWIDGGVK